LGISWLFLNNEENLAALEDAELDDPKFERTFDDLLEYASFLLNFEFLELFFVSNV
jgi:hypothetical protein